MAPNTRISIVVSVILWLIISLSAILLCQAQTPPAASVNFTSDHERVLVAPQGDVTELHLIITNAAGQVVFDSGTVAAQPLEWNMTDAQGTRVADGVYLCAISYRDSSGKLRKRVEQVTVAPQAQTTVESSASAPTPATITGGGTINRLPKFTGTYTIGDSIVTESFGEIGINTTGPTAVLHVNESQPASSTGNGVVAPLLLQTSGGKGGNTTGSGTSAGSGASVAIFAGNGGDAPTGSANGSGGTITLQPGGPGSGAGSAGSNGFVLLAPMGGNVGVGTTNPTAKLSVVGMIQSKTGGVMYPDNTVQTTAGISQAGADTRYVQLTGGNNLHGNETITGTLNVNGSLNGLSGSFSNTLTVGESLSANTINSSTGYSIGGNKVLSIAGGNTFVGVGAGSSNPTTSSNTFVGFQAGQKDTTAGNNTFVGFQAGQSNTTSSDNAFFGYLAGQNNSTGATNSFFGSGAGQSNQTGNGNAFFGFQAGNSNQTGSLNAFFGNTAGQSNQTGSGNAYFGNAAGVYATGNANAFFGGLAGAFNTGGGNAFFGNAAGLNNQAGNFNAFFGYRAGQSNTTESGNTFIGSNSNGVAGITNATALGANTQVSQSNTIQLGSHGESVNISGNLTVVSCTGCTNASSDRNLKANFALVDGRTILSKLAGIAIQSWNYKSEGAGIRHIGPMAQDFHAAFAVGSDDKHINTVDEGGVALAAIQELYLENQELYRENLVKEKQVEELKAANAALEKRLAALESAVEKLTKK